MSTADFKQKALKDLRIIRDEILDLATDSDIFCKFQKEVMQRNARLLKIRSPFIDMLNRSYVHATAARIRRLTDRHKDCISVAKLLEELQNHPVLLKRQLGVENMVNRVSREELEQDLMGLDAACCPVTDYVDKHVAHHDKRQRSALPKHRDVNAAIDKLIEIFKKYYALLNGADTDVVVSYLEGPLAVFRFAWLPEKSTTSR